jgi:hypothetical protein
MWDSVYFVSAGFLTRARAWSLLVLPRPENRTIGKSWLKVDGIQSFLTIAIIFSAHRRTRAGNRSRRYLSGVPLR